ncbi:MAG: hypothetical protein WBA57_11705 [Elainellaceae cyanobacterium]
MPFYTCFLSVGLVFGAPSASLSSLPTVDAQFPCAQSELRTQSESYTTTDDGDRSNVSSQIAHRGSGRRDTADCSASVSCLPTS